MKKKSLLYKIGIRFRYVLIFCILFITPFCSLLAQDTALNKYGLKVIDNVTAFNKSIAGQPNKMMVDVKKSIDNIVIDLKYASRNNFMHKKLYPNTSATYLRLPAVIALSAVQRELNKNGYGLIIWDAYRPYSVTEKMWEMVKDDRYAADPKFGSGHNRGVAVDLTIYNLQTMQELNMGTGFDNFSDTAHHDFKQLPAATLQNRMMLRTLMEKNGFKALETEWWHYFLPNTKEYELLDLSFKDLSKMMK